PPTPIPTAVLAASMQRGIDYLVKNQNKDGSWGGPSWKGGVFLAADIPGTFRSWTAAVTALCVEALIDASGTPPRSKMPSNVGRTGCWNTYAMFVTIPLTIYRTFGPTHIPYKRSRPCTAGCPTIKTAAARSRS